MSTLWWAGGWGSRAKASRVETADGLAPALEAGFAGGRVHLVDVPVDYSENMRTLVDAPRTHAPKQGEAA